jgi:hypothetical protein
MPLATTKNIPQNNQIESNFAIKIYRLIKIRIARPCDSNLRIAIVRQMVRIVLQIVDCLTAVNPLSAESAVQTLQTAGPAVQAASASATVAPQNLFFSFNGRQLIFPVEVYKHEKVFLFILTHSRVKFFDSKTLAISNSRQIEPNHAHTWCHLLVEIRPK